MKTIPVRGGSFAKVDDADFEYLSRFKWRLTEGYAVTGVQSTRMHRMIRPEAGELDIDHEDGDRLNNQRVNLRVCTRSQNIQNSRPRVCATKTSRFKGVNWNAATSKWRARIKAGGRHLPLGCHISEVDAAIAYDRAALCHFGEFARTNLPKENYLAHE